MVKALRSNLTPPRPGGLRLGRAGVAGLARLLARGAAVMTAARPVLGITCCTRRMGTEFGQAVINRYVAAAMRWADVAACWCRPARLMSARRSRRGSTGCC